MTATAQPNGYFSLRERLLSQPYALRRLDYQEVLSAGHVLVGEGQTIRIYGMQPSAWYPLGIRIVGRTAVELTRDEHAAFLATAVAQTFAARGVSVSAIVDPFLGSGNLLFHLARTIPAKRAVGIENNPEIFSATLANFRVLQSVQRVGRVDLAQEDWTAVAGLAGIGPALYVVHPPWGDAYTEAGLDLRWTSPPVPEMLAALPRPAFALVQMKGHTVPPSIDAIEAGATVLPTLRSGNADIDKVLDYRLLALR